MLPGWVVGDGFSIRHQFFDEGSEAELVWAVDAPAQCPTEIRAPNGDERMEKGCLGGHGQDAGIACRGLESFDGSPGSQRGALGGKEVSWVDGAEGPLVRGCGSVSCGDTVGVGVKRGCREEARWIRRGFGAVQSC